MACALWRSSNTFQSCVFHSYYMLTRHCPICGFPKTYSCTANGQSEICNFLHCSADPAQHCPHHPSSPHPWRFMGLSGPDWWLTATSRQRQDTGDEEAFPHGPQECATFFVSGFLFWVASFLGPWQWPSSPLLPDVAKERHNRCCNWECSYRGHRVLWTVSSPFGCTALPGGLRDPKWFIRRNDNRQGVVVEGVGVGVQSDVSCQSLLCSAGTLENTLGDLLPRWVKRSGWPQVWTIGTFRS